MKKLSYLLSIFMILSLFGCKKETKEEYIIVDNPNQSGYQTETTDEVKIIITITDSEYANNELFGVISAINTNNDYSVYQYQFDMQTTQVYKFARPKNAPLIIECNVFFTDTELEDEISGLTTVSEVYVNSVLVSKVVGATEIGSAYYHQLHYIPS